MDHDEAPGMFTEWALLREDGTVFEGPLRSDLEPNWPGYRTDVRTRLALTAVRRTVSVGPWTPVEAQPDQSPALRLVAPARDDDPPHDQD